MLRNVVLALLLVSCSVAAASEPIFTIKAGFLTGNQYRLLSQEARRTYAMGLLDGIFLAPFFGAKKETLGWLERCATGMNDEQIAAIFDKYLRDNPGRWHETMNNLGLVAVKNACVL